MIYVLLALSFFRHFVVDEVTKLYVRHCSRLSTFLKQSVQTIQLGGHVLESRLFHSLVMTLGKLFTHVCLYHKAACII